MARLIEPRSSTMVHHEDALVDSVAASGARTALFTCSSAASAAIRRLTHALALRHLAFALLGHLLEAV